MSMKLKALGLGLLALLAMSVFVVNASATKGGHFTSDVDHTIIKGTESNPGNHNLKFQRTVNGQASGLPIECTHVNYHGTVTVKTTQEITVTPEYKDCATQGGVWGEVKVHHPKTAECETKVFKFTSAEPGKKGTVHVTCPITITHPNCTIRVPTQTVSGVTYNQVNENGKHAITLGVTVPGIAGQFEGGICIFLGTNQTFDMNGSVTVWGEDTDGNRVNVTAT